MKSTSNTQPDKITPDWGSHVFGKIDLLIHWDIAEKTGTTPDNQPYTYWEYQEERIRVDVPTTDQAGITAYINENTDRYFRVVGAPAPIDIQWKSGIKLSLLGSTSQSSISTLSLDQRITALENYTLEQMLL